MASVKKQLAEEGGADAAAADGKDKKSKVSARRAGRMCARIAMHAG